MTPAAPPPAHAAPNVPSLIHENAVPLWVLQVWNQQVLSNCVIKREQEKCLEMITADDLDTDPDFGRRS